MFYSTTFLLKQDVVIKKKLGRSPKLPSGKIVGIIKRNWRQYCGILQKSLIKEVIIYKIVNIGRISFGKNFVSVRDAFLGRQQDICSSQLRERFQKCEWKQGRQKLWKDRELLLSLTPGLELQDTLT